MKVLVVGSKGFLGSHVTQKIKKDTNYDLIEIEGKEKVDITNFENLNSYFTQNKPEVVINCAAFVGGISYGYKYPAQMLHLNSSMAINLYLASKNNNVKKLINPISNCAYPKKFNVYKEENFFDGPPDESVFNYGISKRLYVQLGDTFFKEYNFSSVNVIVSNMYGPSDHFDIDRSHALGAIIKKIYDAKKSGEKEVIIWGTGKPIREWLFVKDGADALIKSINLDEGHYFFNVGIEKGISIIDLAEIIKEKMNWNGNFILDQSKPDGVLEKKVDGSLGQEVLNWKPKVSLSDGIQETVDWYFKTYE